MGGGNPVAVQSMLNVPIHDIAGNVAQAKRLEAEKRVELHLHTKMSEHGWFL